MRLNSTRTLIVASLFSLSAWGCAPPEEPNPDAGYSCAAVPTCDSGDERVTGSCPDGGSCYQRTTCDQTITCLDDDADGGTDAGPSDTSELMNSCGAAPVCDRGDEEVTGGCPDGGNCYEVTACEMTITCLATGDAGSTDASSPSDTAECGTGETFVQEACIQCDGAGGCAEREARCVATCGERTDCSSDSRDLPLGCREGVCRQTCF